MECLVLNSIKNDHRWKVEKQPKLETAATAKGDNWALSLSSNVARWTTCAIDDRQLIFWTFLFLVLGRIGSVHHSFHNISNNRDELIVSSIECKCVTFFFRLFFIAVLCRCCECFNCMSVLGFSRFRKPTNENVT